MSSLYSSGVIGALGCVTTRIGGPGKAGEVQVSLNGGSESFIAYGDEAIDRGVQVMVVATRPGRVVEVTIFDG